MTVSKQGHDDSYSERRIFAVLGVLPEPGGYGIAKFSRSSTPYQKWIMDLTQEGAEKFYESFYFDYGHASIADLAHLTIVIENVSMVAAEELWDEPLIDGQASSTRYQDFEKRGFHTPEELHGTKYEEPYRALCQKLIGEYKAFHKEILAYLVQKYAHERPPGMDDAKYERTMKARTFDIVRYLLSMSIRTGLGHIMSARTLERQLVRLFSHPLKEVQAIAQELKDAVKEKPAFNPMVERLKPILQELEGQLPKDERTEKLLNELKRITHFGAPAVPTLVKYTNPSEYLMKTYQALREYAATLSLGKPDAQRDVTLIEPHDQTTEKLCTPLYRVSPYSYTQIKQAVDKMSNTQKRELLDLAYKYRGKHDQPIRETRTGYNLIFDLCLDCGAWRDFHRHRRCVQINKDFNALYGFDTPKEIEQAGLAERYAALMKEAAELSRAIDKELPLVGQYALPFAFRRRCLLKLDAEELQYIVELRTRPENHFSVREIAYKMYEQFAGRYPEQARYFRATPPDQEEFFKR